MYAMASSSVHSPGKRQVPLDHREPEKPLVYEPPDLHGRKHVEKIATEYRVREDGCLADRLQNEEFELHFGKNKVDNKILHMDLKTAKTIYLKEVEDSGMLSRDELGKLCKDDEFIAKEIEKRVNENKDLESHAKAAIEMQDEEFAMYLQTKEKQKVDQERKDRLQRHLQRDRLAAEKLQRELNLQAEREELVARGVSEVRLSGEKSVEKSNWNVVCENGTHPDEKVENSMKLAEQRLHDEERDRKIAIKLQREEAEVYQRAKREKQMRRAQTERRHEDDSAERGRHAPRVDSKGRPIAVTPPDGRKTRHTANRTDTPASLKYLPGVIPGNDRTDSPTSLKYLPGVIPGRDPPTASPIRTEDSSKKNIHSVDASVRPVRDPLNSRPSRRNKGSETPPPLPPPDEGIYLTAVDSIGAVQAHDPNDFRTRTCSEPKPKRNVQKQSSLPLSRTDSWGIESTSSEEGQTIHRNIAADIDPTYSTISHFSPQSNHVTKKEGDIRPAPVVQNIKRPTLTAAEKKKKKWFSKKEKSR